MKTVKTKHFTVLLVLLAVATLTLTSCFDDDDSVYATNADFGIVSSDYLGRLVSFTTDNDDYKIFNEAVTGTGADPDTIYRALVYYSATSDDATYVDYYYLIPIDVFTPIEVANTDSLPTDPIISVDDKWLSANYSYINLLITLYPVYTDGDYHEVTFVKTTDTDGTTVLTMYHKNPGTYYTYYTSSSYLSIPIKGYFNSGESVRIEIKTENSANWSWQFTIPELNNNVSNL